MFLEIILSIVLGIFFGSITGLIPGLHINLVSITVVSLATTIFFKINPIYLAIFIVSMSITHTFIDFIPSIFLGCPDSDTELSILPGHELLKQGHGYQAILLTLYGSFAAVIILAIISIPFGWAITKSYETLSRVIPFLIISILIVLICLENKKINSIAAIIISGTLGLIVFNFPEKILNQPLLPLLTGLFGTSNLILSIKNKTQIPPQKIKEPKAKILRPLIGSIIASPICTILPGLGSGQAAIIGHTISNPKNDKKSFLILQGATNTLVMGFSFITLYLISKTRTGSAIAIQELIGQIDIKIMVLLMAVILISGVISFYISKSLAKIFSKKFQKINYTKLSITTIIFLALLTTIISGFLGLLVLIASTIAGIYCISLKVRRTNMMGALLIPTILFYLGINLF